MRFFKDGRGLLRRVRWVRVIAVTAAIGAGVAWASREDDAAANGALKTLSSSSCLRCDHEIDYGEQEDLSNVILIDGVLGSATRSGYQFEAPLRIPADLHPCGK